MIVISKAGIGDVEKISRLIDGYARQNKMLPRTPSEIFENIRDFFVAKKKGRLVGCCALHIYWRDLAEIRSLAVEPKSTRKGIGTALVKACIRELKKMGIRRVFSLTLKPEFFKAVGFREVDKNELPMKIWADCIRCPKFTECDEKAFVLDVKRSPGSV